MIFIILLKKKSKSDIGREGPMSKGKQPRVSAEVPNLFLSD